MLSRLYSRWSQAVDIVCYLLIMAGISVDAVYLPASPNKIDVRATRPAHLPSAWLSTPALDTRTRATGSCTWSCRGYVFQVHDLSRLFREPVGIIFWMVLLTVLMSMQGTDDFALSCLRCTSILHSLLQSHDNKSALPSWCSNNLVVP